MTPPSVHPRPSSSAPVLDRPALPAADPSWAVPASAVPASAGSGCRPDAPAAMGVPGARAGRRARGRPTEAVEAAARRRAEALLGDGEPAPAEVGPVPGGDAVPPERVERPGASALRERLPLWFQLRCGLEPKTTAALGVVLAGLAVLAGAHFWSAGPEGVHVPEAVRVAAGTSAVPRTENVRAEVAASPAAPRPASPTAPGAMTADQILVDVNGKVRRPGVQHLRAGARVADALDAAGGVLTGTDVTGLNRARVLTDGEQVLVGLPPAGPPPDGAGASGAGAGPVAPTGPLSLSTATAEQLETLPGVGPVLAQHIVDYRVEHGGYGSVDELREVTGIGDRRFDDLQPLVRP
ncbi:helix-hairpin-helix domain-containing protein [Streptomyces sp. NBC_00101]|uniref:helix-hairpin-helix domain-containing protein n=1 Tax=Streptomyces sp. NBC_00101 TaxID=2975651 RepID=UPI00324BF390